MSSPAFPTFCLVFGPLVLVLPLFTFSHFGCFSLSPFPLVYLLCFLPSGDCYVCPCFYKVALIYSPAFATENRLFLRLVSAFSNFTFCVFQFFANPHFQKLVAFRSRFSLCVQPIYCFWFLTNINLKLFKQFSFNSFKPKGRIQKIS
jgi:hypothetical protein